MTEVEANHMDPDTEQNPAHPMGLSTQNAHRLIQDISVENPKFNSIHSQYILNFGIFHSTDGA